MTSAIAQSHPNIALIKYWGNLDEGLRLPANGSISMNLDGLYTRTQVTFDSALEHDCLELNGAETFGPALERVSSFLEHVRRMSDFRQKARIVSENNFPIGTGIASSASAFASLALAASTAAGLDLNERQLSRLARLGSGSASRSVPGGYVEWLASDTDEQSYAYSIAPSDHWQLADCVAIVSQVHKPTGSSEGHPLAATSPLQAARVADTPRRLELCRQAILTRDFQTLAELVELDSNMMHAVMITSTPPLLYWRPETVAIMQAVQEWRLGGLPVFYTIDAGPNVHVLCPPEHADEVTNRLRAMQGVIGILTAQTGGPAQRVSGLEIR
jgi:diphosphomevalonate decarboxylase